MTEPGLFANESAPYGDFKHIGTSYAGRVLRIGKQQSRKFDPKNPGQGELEVWPDNGGPKWTYIVTVQTDLRDPSIEHDDGSRSVWIKGKSMTDSVKAAVKRAGASTEGILVGGYFSMKFTHETPNDWGGAPTKNYEVKYVPPEAGADHNGVVTGQQAQEPVAVPGPTGQQGLDYMSPEIAAKVNAMLAQQQGSTPR